ncbi:MAG: HEAT repeat domain-containing protein [Candidatus Brocadiia bacterium]
MRTGWIWWVLFGGALFLALAWGASLLSDERDWDIAESADLASIYEYYLQTHPVGKHADEARAAINRKIAEEVNYDLAAEIAARLQSPDAAERGDAAEEAKELDGKVPQFLISCLADLLYDDTEYVWKFPSLPRKVNLTTPGEQASDALASIGGQAIDALANVLSNGTPYAKSLAVEALFGIGNRDQRTSGLIFAASLDTSPIVRLAVARALGGMGADGASEALVRLAGDASRDVRLAVMETLSTNWIKRGHNPKVVRPVVIAGISDPDAEIRALAASGMTCYVQWEEGDRKLVIALLGDPDMQVRKAASEALAQSTQIPEVTQALLAVMTGDREMAVRDSAAEALASKPDLMVLEKLINCAAEGRISANNAVGAAKTVGEGSIPLLKEMLASTNDRLAIVAWHCLDAASGDKILCVTLAQARTHYLTDEK